MSGFTPTMVDAPAGYLTGYSTVSLTTTAADILTLTAAQRLRLFGLYWYVDAGAELIVEINTNDIFRIDTTSDPNGFINLYPLFIEGALGEDLTGRLNAGTANGYFTTFYTTFVL